MPNHDTNMNPSGSSNDATASGIFSSTDTRKVPTLDAHSCVLPYFENLKRGLNRRQAARAAGVSMSAIRDIINDNVALQMMETECVQDAISIVEQKVFENALAGNQRAAEFFLINRSRDWRNTNQVVIVDDTEKPVEAMSDEELQSVISRSLNGTTAAKTSPPKPNGVH